MTGRPSTPPVGLLLTRSARVVERAFDDAMATAGGSTSTWSILLALISGGQRSQRELAAAVGLHGATLTHHLAGLECDGLVTRHRDPANRRNQLVELTAEGRERFLRLRELAAAFDTRLRGDLPPQDLETFARVLARLRGNVEG